MSDQTSRPDDLVPAGFWIRAGAYMIDNLLVGCLIIPLALISSLRGAMPLFQLVISATYFTWMTAAYKGQTLGKRFVGIAVVRNDGSPLGAGRAFLRWFGYIVSSLPASLGFLMAVFNEKHYALHDLMAGTRVVRIQDISSRRKIVVVGVALVLPFVAFVGIIAAIAVPQFARFQSRSKEAVDKSSLAIVRTGLALYQADSQKYPTDLTQLLPKYAETLTPMVLAQHPASAQVHYYGGDVCSGSKDADSILIGSKLQDSGGYGYVNDPKASCFGHVFVDCTHASSDGKEWYRY